MADLDVRFRGEMNSARYDFAGNRHPKLPLSTIHIVWIVLSLVVVRSASATSIDFEGFPDSIILTTQYPGVTSINAIILTDGISLNEFQFPPRSAANVASDKGGPITIDSNTPITRSSGYFTYLEPLTIYSNATNNQVGSANSMFSNNLASIILPKFVLNPEEQRSF